MIGLGFMGGGRVVMGFFKQSTGLRLVKTAERHGGLARVPVGRVVECPFAKPGPESSVVQPALTDAGFERLFFRRSYPIDGGASDRAGGDFEVWPGWGCGIYQHRRERG